jgi:hypothetical protein
MVSFAYHNRSDAIARQALSRRRRNFCTVSIIFDASSAEEFKYGYLAKSERGHSNKNIRAPWLCLPAIIRTYIPRFL